MTLRIQNLEKHLDSASNDASFRGLDDLDIEKCSGLQVGSPISTTSTTISCSIFSSYPSASQYDVRWSPPSITQY